MTIIRKDCGHKSKLFQGVGEISKTWWREHITRGGKNHAKYRRKQIQIFITIQEAWDLFLKQNRKCALTGIDLDFPQTITSKGTASLDRIDPNGDYVLSNVQWVHKRINRVKNDCTQAEFIQLCNMVAKRNPC